MHAKEFVSILPGMCPSINSKLPGRLYLFQILETKLVDHIPRRCLVLLHVAPHRVCPSSWRRRPATSKLPCRAMLLPLSSCQYMPRCPLLGDKQSRLPCPCRSPTRCYVLSSLRSHAIYYSLPTVNHVSATPKPRSEKTFLRRSFIKLPCQRPRLLGTGSLPA